MAECSILEDRPIVFYSEKESKSAVSQRAVITMYQSEANYAISSRLA